MKKKNIIIVVSIILIGLLHQTCIDEYKASSKYDLKDILVVDGFISDNITTIKLSRTVGINEDTSNGFPTVDNARVEVECNDGTVYKVLSSVVENGEYNIPIPLLEKDKQYRVKIYLDGKEYESQFRSPMFTPDVEDIYLEKEKRGAPVKSKTSYTTQGDKYYTYSHQEIYQFRAALYKNFMTLAGGTKVEYDENNGPKNTIYNCWVWKKSTSNMLISTKAYKEGERTSITFAEDVATSQKFSFLYYIKVTKNELSANAYEYYSVLKKNTEETGSIFGPIISELEGNITCVTSPADLVIGYIEASNTRNNEKFFPVDYNIYEILYDGCEALAPDDKRLNLDVHEILWYDFEYGEPLLYALPKCSDCRMNGGGKKRPSFWPNDDV